MSLTGRPIKPEYTVGIIGHGFAGQLHREATTKVEDGKLRVVALCDTNPENLSEWAKNYKTCDTIGEFPDDLDAVILATPTKLHLEHVKEVVKKWEGKDLRVLLEKPMGVNTGEAEEIQRLLSASAIRCMVGLTGLYHPEFVAAYDALCNNGIGKIVSISERIHFGIPNFPMQYVSRDHSGKGVVLENGIHTFQHFYHFGEYHLGGRIVRMEGVEMGNTHLKGECEDYAFGTAVGSNGIRAHFSLRWSRDVEEDYVLELTGINGRITVEGFKLCTITKRDKTRKLYEHDRNASLRVRHLPGFVAEQEEFVRFIEGSEPSQNVGCAIQAQQAVDMVYAS